MKWRYPWHIDRHISVCIVNSVCKWIQRIFLLGKIFVLNNFISTDGIVYTSFFDIFVDILMCGNLHIVIDFKFIWRTSSMHCFERYESSVFDQCYSILNHKFASSRWISKFVNENKNHKNETLTFLDRWVETDLLSK